MPNSLYARLALVLMVAFSAVAAMVVVATQEMFEARRLLLIVSELVVGAVAFSLIAALIVFHFLTRRLRQLADAIDSFRGEGFARPVRLISADPRGDEIERLAAAFQEMSGRIACQVRELEQVDERRRELLANVSHDLRTPLASMQGYLETLLLHGQTLTPEQSRSYIEVAARHSERLSLLVRDLFELTKLEANEIQPKPEAFPIAELVQDVVQKFQLGAGKRGLTIAAGCPEGVPQVAADIGMVERVLENLIENAMRHTPEGGAVRVELERGEARVRVHVSDTGCGIAADELRNIFERYYRIDRGENGAAGNAGLGLAITRRLVMLHGGDIRVDSAPGRGTRFSFDLPVAVSPTQPAPASA